MLFKQDQQQLELQRLQPGRVGERRVVIEAVIQLRAITAGVVQW